MNTKKIVKDGSDIEKSDSKAKFSVVNFSSLGVAVCGEMNLSDYEMFENLRSVAEAAEYENICDYVKIDELAFAVEVLNRFFGKNLLLKITEKY